MNFLEELSWRGMLQDQTPGIQEELDKGPVVGYIGFDPTAPSMTIGNYVQIMLLKIFQMTGNKPIVLMGGATGRIGDPSGKDKERELTSYEVLDSNLEFQKKQIEKFLDFEGEHAAVIVNNIDFYKEMNVLSFLRDVGKTLTVNYMTSKESVKNRLETGLSFTEFSYQLLQAYDYQCLYDQFNCRLQMGGSDQWGNITSGTEFIRRNIGGKAFAATTPLLTKADGTKFGKSTKGNIWIDGNLTSPYKFFQFWINADDKDIGKFTRYFTLHSKEEIEAREKEYADDFRMQKLLLAEELTKRVHSVEDYEAVQKVSQILFNNKANAETLLSLDKRSLETVAGEIPSFTIKRNELSNGLNIVDFLSENTEIVKSKGEARRAIKGNAISINKNKVSSHEINVNHEDLLHGRFIMVENGRKNKFMVLAL